MLVKAGGMSENLVSVLYCGLLVQKAGRLSFNSVVNEYPRGNSLWTEGAFPKGMLPRPLSILTIKGSCLPCVWESRRE